MLIHNHLEYELLLEKTLFSAGIIVSFVATGDENIKKAVMENVIFRFVRFNIVERYVMSAEKTFTKENLADILKAAKAKR